MGYLPTRGDVLFIPHTGPSHTPERGHLFVVLTERCSEGYHLLVPACTLRNRSDKTCLVGPGDHVFFKVMSFIAYQHMNVYQAQTLSRQVDGHVISDQGRLDIRIFALIGAGVAVSPFSAPKFKEIYKCKRPSACKKCLPASLN